MEGRLEGANAGPLVGAGQGEHCKICLLLTSLPIAVFPPRSENFKDTEWVKVPKVLWDYSSSSVLTMEYTPGVKINKGALLVPAVVRAESCRATSRAC